VHLYLAVALLVWLVGLGVQRLVVLPGGAWREATLAPVTGLAALTLLLRAAVELGPLDRVEPAVWALVVALAGVGAREAIRQRASLRAHALDVGLLLLLPCVVLGPRVWGGLFDHPGSAATDGWGYAVQAEFLRSRWPGSEGGMTPVYEFGAMLSSQRCSSASWLGLLAPWTPTGDAQAARSPYVAVCLFVLGASAMCAAVEVGLSPRWRRIATSLTLVAGWTHVMVAFNNLDQLLWTSFVPAALTLVPAAELGVVVGIVLAAAFVGYPELTPFLGLSALGVVLVRAARGGPPWRLPWRALAAGGLCAAPFAPRSLRFLAQQAANASKSSDRSGDGMLPELLDPLEAVGNWWRLVPSDTLLGGAAARPYRCMAGLLLFALAARGARLLWRRDQPAAACVLAVCWPLAAALLFVHRYEYGAYKLLATAWWAACLALCVALATWARPLAVRAAGAAALAGAITLDGALHHTRLGVWTLGARPWLDALVSGAIVVAMGCCLRPAAPGSGLRRGGAWRLALPALLALWGLRQVVRGGRFDSTLDSMAPYRAVTEVAAIVGAEPVWVGVDDPQASEWALYYLRDAEVRLHARRSWLGLGGSVPLMDRARGAQDEVEAAPFLVVDGGLEPPGWTTLWRGGAYRLVRPSSPRWLFVAGLDGLAREEGALDGAAPLDVLACAAGEVELRWTSWRPGALLLWRVGDPAPAVLVPPGPQAVRFQVPRGSSRWALRRVDRSRPILEGARATLAR
jgi:hypothetical protein